MTATIQKGVQSRVETMGSRGKGRSLSLDGAEELVVEPLMQREHELVPVGEVHVEGPLGHAGSSGEICDRHFIDLPGVQQGRCGLQQLQACRVVNVRSAAGPPTRASRPCT